MIEKQILTKARELLTLPEAWLKCKWEEYDDFGQPVAWCLMGAISRAANLINPTEKYELYGVTRAHLCSVVGYPNDGGRLIDFNNDPNKTHEQVLELLDKAVKEN